MAISNVSTGSPKRRLSSIEHAVSVAAGSTETVVLDGVPEPITVTALPGVGGTALVESSTSGLDAVNGGTATWIAWDGGTVAVDTTDSLVSPVTALRFTATTADAVFEVVA